MLAGDAGCSNGNEPSHPAANAQAQTEAPTEKPDGGTPAKAAPVSTCPYLSRVKNLQVANEGGPGVGEPLMVQQVVACAEGVAVDVLAGNPPKSWIVQIDTEEASALAPVFEDQYRLEETIEFPPGKAPPILVLQDPQSARVQWGIHAADLSGAWRVLVPKR